MRFKKLISRLQLEFLRVGRLLLLELDRGLLLTRCVRVPVQIGHGLFEGAQGSQKVLVVGWKSLEPQGDPNAHPCSVTRLVGSSVIP